MTNVKGFTFIVKNYENSYITKGHPTEQLCLPKSRVHAALEMGHNDRYAGLMAAKITKQRIRFSFWFPDMDKLIREYCKSCAVCQMRAPVRIRDHIPITPIGRR